ncbi:Phosphoenolpyruvate-dependent sugar phosphotransferase system, EIIA component [Mycoplasma haemocanis str. Illinois]|uniref:Phosphoenolpyruvate-dependent sugar phosphotransferase system, EIIA component n=1 Tax=Mycoplasma haemocanis (strain Illinois) TaxID=1111676 RepID=H6N5V9_MYCHN|nr:PTS glucose transporter subunit IIA [Mycoplasma haemocanis]AEW44874.1 Phosphoenolpyruvate-dependent sugar phosphotransferase system, EIIA component [Mycoplasma haemocanis str. Illinois]
MIKKFFEDLVKRFSKGGGSTKSSIPGVEVKKPLKLDIFAPCDGTVVPQKDIPDEGFSETHMGVGLGIKPSGSKVVCPMTGKLIVLFQTKHAYIIKDEVSGVSVLLHLGINTVNIAPELGAFSTIRKVEDELKAKDELCDMNLEVIEKEATSTISALLVQHDEMEGKKVVLHVESGEVKKGDLLMSVVSA